VDTEEYLRVEPSQCTGKPQLIEAILKDSTFVDIKICRITVVKIPSRDPPE
jgi:hypothetical protein